MVRKMIKIKYNDNTNTVSIVIEKDFDIARIYYDIFITAKAGELRDLDGQTIVHYFVRTKNLKAIRQCITKGIPISIKDDNGKTINPYRTLIYGKGYTLFAGVTDESVNGV